MRFIGKQSDKIGDATKITLGSTASNQTTDLGSKDIVSLFSAGNGTSITVSNFESGELFQTIVAFNGINASTSAKGVAQFSSDNFAASSGTITIKDGGVDLTAEVTGVLPSANLDADTAHLSTDQTFTGTKTFDETISGSISGSAATVTGAAQTNITSLGTLTALDVDSINLNTRNITITGDTDDTFTIVTGAAGATTLTTHDEAGTAGHFEVAADGNITLDAAGDIALEAGGADVDITADHVTITSSSASDPTLKLKSTTNDSNGCQIQLRNDKGAAGADGDGIGSIRFIGDDAAQTQTEFGKIICQVSEADDSDEAGKMRFMVAESDGTTTALTTGLSIEGEHATDGQVDVTIAAGSASTTAVAGDLTVGRTLSVVNRIELGDGSSNQTDTSITRSAAGTVTIEGETVATTKTEVITSGNAGALPLVTMMARRTLTTAEMNSLHSTSIQVAPPPGANKVALPVGGMIRVDRASTNTNGSSMNFHYASTTGTFGSDSIVHIRRFHFNKTTDGVYNLGGSNITGGLVQISLTKDANKAIEVSFDVASTTDCFTSVDIFLTYQIIQIA